jgi:hypothetical protein
MTSWKGAGTSDGAQNTVTTLTMHMGMTNTSGVPIVGSTMEMMMMDQKTIMAAMTGLILLAPLLKWWIKVVTNSGK